MKSPRAPKIPKITQLPSGNYFCQLRLNGKSISISEENYDTVYAKAVAIKAGIFDIHRHPEHITLGEAMDNYITARDGVLSPTTIRAYKVIKRNYFLELQPLMLSSITKQRLQRSVSDLSKKLSPKSVRNSYALVSSAMKDYNISFDIILPQKEKYDYSIPATEDLKKIISASIGTKSELPILLAVLLGLRASEIRGIKYKDIKNGCVHICRARVTVGKKSVEKLPKTTSSDRILPLPEYLLNLIGTGDPEEYLVPERYRNIYDRFCRLCNSLGLSSHYRFHDLRHANASIMLAIGIPNKYAQERMGHSTDNMLKSVYQHTFKSQTDEYSKALNTYFANELLTPIKSSFSPNEN